MDFQTQPEIFAAGLKNTTYPVEGREEGHGYLSKPPQESKFGLVLIQEWWGLNESICITADKFAKQGFYVLAPDVYRGKQAKDREEAGHYFNDLDFAGAVADIKGAGLYLKNTLGLKKVGVLGFCLGGALSFGALSGTQGVFDAGSPFYGTPDLSKYPLKNITVPVQAHFGELDQLVGFSDIETAKKVEKEAKELKLDFQLVIHQGANHAFMNQNLSYYSPEIAAKILIEVPAFFKKVFES